MKRDNVMRPAVTTVLFPGLISRGAALVLVSVLAGLALVQALLQPPAADFRLLAIYMAASAIVSLAIGVLAVMLVERHGPSTLRMKVAMSTLVGAAVGMLNILLVARLMFVSTAHDLRLLISLVVMSGVVAFGFSLWIGMNVTRRLVVVTEAIRRLAEGDLGARVDIGSSDEVASLARDVTMLAERLQKAEAARGALDRDRRDLTVAISHDLRTPLSSIRAMTEALADGVVTDAAEVARYYATIRHETEHLTRLVDDLFHLSQFDAGAIQLDRQWLVLSDVAAEVADAMQSLAEARGVALRLRPDVDVPMVQVDGALVERAIRNLVMNALQHTPVGGAVEVAVSTAADHVELRVTDSGEGIAADDLPRVWERFFRGDRSRGRQQSESGAGLGLAIVRGTIEAHGGRVGVSSQLGQGSTFRFELPTVTGATRA